MFTGLIEDIGTVQSVTRTGGERAHRITLVARLLDEEMPLGASLAVDGTCLTIVDWSRGKASMLAAAETLERTTLGQLSVGARVNLERPLRVGDRLGGHMVAGHVDGVGHVLARLDRGAALDVTIATPAPLLRYVIEKGSIALDGISLTVNHVDERGFSVSLIPHTQGQTTIAAKAVGAAVNLEVDLIGKYVEKLVGAYRGQPEPGTITLQQLKENGFV